MFAKLSGLMNQNNLLHCFDPSKNFMSSTLQKKKKKPLPVLSGESIIFHKNNSVCQRTLYYRRLRIK